jgi:hypothetical protein
MAIVALCAALGCCATSAPLSETVISDYRKLADCVYLRLAPEVGPGLNKADAPTQGASRISLESGGMRYWELLISTAGPNQSRVEFTPARNMWGSDAGGGTGLVRPAIQACSH